MQRSVHVEDVSVRPSNSDSAGPDRRVTASRWSMDPYGVHVFRQIDPSRDAIFDGGSIVEVQAYVPSERRDATVEIGLMARSGHMGIQLSPSEARAIGLSLLTAADEAEDLMARR